MKRVFAVECDCDGCEKNHNCHVGEAPDFCEHVFQIMQDESLTVLGDLRMVPEPSWSKAARKGRNESDEGRSLDGLLSLSCVGVDRGISTGELAKRADRLASQKANRAKR
jgi:hypothetical protein